jgi:hypothetical protein
MLKFEPSRAFERRQPRAKTAWPGAGAAVLAIFRPKTIRNPSGMVGALCISAANITHGTSACCKLKQLAAAALLETCSNDVVEWRMHCNTSSSSN